MTRESNIQEGFFILSVFVKGEVIHRVAPNKDGLIKKQSFEEATLILSELILAKEDCCEPLSPGFCASHSDPIEKERSNAKHAVILMKIKRSCKIMRELIMFVSVQVSVSPVHQNRKFIRQMI